MNESRSSTSTGPARLICSTLMCAAGSPSSTSRPRRTWTSNARRPCRGPGDLFDRGAVAVITLVDQPGKLMVREVISIPGIERMARLMALLVRQVDAMSVAGIKLAP